jgi:hypothetical protein
VVLEMKNDDEIEKIISMFLKLWGEAAKNVDEELQSTLNRHLGSLNVNFPLVFISTFNDDQYGSPAFSLGFNFPIPVGAIYINKSWKDLPERWKEFIILHELGHIYHNHSPFNVLVSILYKVVPKELRELYNIIKVGVSFYSILEGKEIPKFIEEQITAAKELEADKFALQLLGDKRPILEFFWWLKRNGISISHLSEFGEFRLPALTVDERVEHIGPLGSNF